MQDLGGISCYCFQVDSLQPAIQVLPVQESLAAANSLQVEQLSLFPTLLGHLGPVSFSVLSIKGFGCFYALM